MTREERNTKLKHFITCLKCEVSGKKCDDNCSVQYEAGNMGEIIENLEAISKALEQESDSFARWVAREIFDDEWEYNKDAFAEIACRKLEKIGIVRAKGDEWELVELEPCKDAINRQAVLKTLDDMDNVLDEDRTIENYKELLKECYEVLSPVTPQPKTGHWIEHPEIETSAPEYLMFYECSECGDKQCFCKSDIHKKRFCNNCGAKMVEPQERSGEE